METNYLPLIFAMRHLRIRFSPGGDITQNACLVQGDRVVPPANDARIEEFVTGTEHAGGTLPEGFELQMLTMQCQGWPEPAVISLAGIVSFGAKDLRRAAACARHALLAPRLRRGRVLSSHLKPRSAYRQIALPNPVFARSGGTSGRLDGASVGHGSELRVRTVDLPARGGDQEPEAAASQSPGVLGASRWRFAGILQGG